MSKRYTDEYKNTIVELYNSGKTLAELNSEYGLPKSTILKWRDFNISKNIYIAYY